MNYKKLHEILPLEVIKYIDEFDNTSQERMNNVIQELNRKLDQNGFTSNIIEPVDAGFRPENLTGFFNNAGYLLNLAGGANHASAWGLKAMTSGDPNVVRIRRHPNVDGEASFRNFKGSEIEDGTLLTWVTGQSSTADGYVIFLYDQSDNNHHFLQSVTGSQPKIVSNGSLIRDSQNKAAIDGKGSKMELSSDRSNFFSSDGTWSLFLVTDFQNYGNASENNVEIITFETETNGGANSKRKPSLSIDKNFNRLSVSTPTQTMGSNTIGNIFLETYPGEQLFSSFGNPSSATNNNEGFLDGVSRGDTGHQTTNLATSVNTSTTAPRFKNILFDPNETGVSTFLSALVYAPSYLFSQKTAIESKLIQLHDITFV